MLKIERFRNFPIESNCNVIYTTESKKCLIIDPGSEDSFEIIRFLNAKDLYPDCIFLTHEHFDHIWGVRHLKQMFNVNVLCSKDCSTAIIHPKKNMSIFYDQIGFELDEADQIITQRYEQLYFNNLLLHFLHTPGHTKGSMCLKVENYLFSGDTILENIKTITKLPGGSKTELKDSIDFILKEIDMETVIMPGHGNSFLFKDLNINKLF